MLQDIYIDSISLDNVTGEAASILTMQQDTNITHLV